MNWTAIVPIKPPARRKTRLAGMDADERLRLTETMLAHVLAVLKVTPGIGRIIQLSVDSHGAPDWIRDEGRGLNAELTAARASLAGDILVIHADLPLLKPDEVAQLLTAAARYGAAIAPDRHGTGTNALAIRAAVPVEFRFGVESCALHARQLPDQAAIIPLPGLATDIDTDDDLALAGLSPD